MSEEMGQHDNRGSRSSAKPPVPKKTKQENPSLGGQAASLDDGFTSAAYLELRCTLTTYSSTGRPITTYSIPVRITAAHMHPFSKDWAPYGLELWWSQAKLPSMSLGRLVSAIGG